MNINTLQHTVSEMVKRYNLTTAIEMRYIDLVSEVGELGKEILKGNSYGKTAFNATENIKHEMGDIFFSLICMANILEIDMEKALGGAMKKYEQRFLATGKIR